MNNNIDSIKMKSNAYPIIDGEQKHLNEYISLGDYMDFYIEGIKRSQLIYEYKNN